MDNIVADFTIEENNPINCTFELFAAGTVWGSISGDINNQTDLIELIENNYNNLEDQITTLDTKVDNNYNELSNGLIEANQDILDLTNTVNSNFTTLNNKIDEINIDLSADISELNTAIQNETTTRAENDTTLQGNIDTLSGTVTSNYNALDARITTNTGNISDINTTLSGYGNIVTHNVSEFATSAQGALADTAIQPNDNISELVNDVGYITSASLPTVNNATITIQKNGSNVGTFTLNQANNDTLNITVPTQASDIGAMPDTTTIEDLTTTAQLSALNSGATTTNIGQITTNQNNIADIRDLIPLQASTSNQLADKGFVNSSIATNTANFIGTFNSVAELEAYSGTLTNNDYAFVATTDAAGNTLYDRYKYNADTQEWLFEYELNNSSFTAVQWAAINSGATSTNIGQITTNANNIADLQTNKQDVISDLTTIRSNALAGKNASDTIATYGNIVTHNVSEFATSSQGALADTALQPNDNISELTNDAGYITGITSSNVTTALGYTPYNSTNPNGYITASALNGYATESFVTSQGYITNSALTGYATEQWVTNQSYVNNTTLTNTLSSYALTSSLAEVATSGDYDDLTNKPTIPTVNNATLTIQKNGTTVNTFTANASSNVTANITVPTDVSDLTNTTLANKDLSNLSSTGESRLHALKGYSDEGELLTDAEGLADVKSYAHSTFDLSKFTVVGSPTITDDGIASGFSSSNYLKGSFTAITPSKIIFRTKAVYSSTSNTANGAQTIGKILGTNSSPSIEYSPSLERLSAIKFHNNSNYANNSANIIVPLNDGDIVEAEVIGTSTSVTLNAKINGVPYTNTWSGNGLYCGAINGYLISNNSNWYWTGSIDLKQFSITVDGKEIFNGNKEGLDVIKPDDYTVVGSPNITDNGIASGFSSSDYLTKSGFSFSSNNIIFQGKINLTPDSTLSSNTRNAIFSTGNFNFQISYKQSDTSYNFELGETTSWSLTSSNVITSGEWDYYLNVNTSSNTLEFKYKKTEDTVWTQGSLSGLNSSNAINAIKNGTSVNICKGYWNSNTNFISIDLNSFKIYVDGDLAYQPCLKIPYTESKTGSKIVSSPYRDRVNDMYEQFGYAPYYTLSDSDFTLPMGEIYGMIDSKADVNLSNSIPSQSFIDNVLDWTAPDWANGLTKSWGDEHTAECAGYLYFSERVVGNNVQSGQLTINGVTAAYDFANWNDTEEHSHFIKVAKNDVYKATGGMTNNRGLIFYPCKGAQV